MRPKITMTPVNRVPFGIALVTALVLLVLSVAFTIDRGVERSSSDMPTTSTTRIGVVHPRTNPRFAEINELHSVRQQSVIESDWVDRLIIDRLETGSLADLRAGDRLPYDSMKFVEMNELPGNAGLVPPGMEIHAGRQ